MQRFKVIIPLLLLVALLLPTAAACSRGADLDSQLDEIIDSYRFSLFEWEIKAIGGILGDFLRGGEAPEDTAFVFDYFDNVGRIRGLRSAIIAPGDADTLAFEDELGSLLGDNSGLSGDVVERLKADIREALAEAGIDNPFGIGGFGFPPIEAVLESPPHLLVISPRDRIEAVRQVHLAQEMSREEMEDIEAQMDALGYSSLVVPLGGIATYPSFVNNDGDLRFTIDTIVHEWLHHYLTFTPLGFLAMLHALGVRQDYDVATISETVVSIVSKEIGAAVYGKYVPDAAIDVEPPQPPATGFDFNAVMRETRLAVDAYLADGEMDQAEQYMERQRLYLADNGYFVRKLNQAYFAFYGTYADSPTSVSPIGADIRTLRERSASLKEFLDAAADLTSVEELGEAITK